MTDVQHVGMNVSLNHTTSYDFDRMGVTKLRDRFINSFDAVLCGINKL